MTTPTKRRLFRFSLRTLLIIVVLLSLPLGWFALKMRRAERQRQAVEAIREAGGWVGYDYEGYEPFVQFVLEQPDRTGGSFRKPEPPSPAWLRRLLGVDFFSIVVVVGFYPSPEFGDEHMRHLRDLADLTVLDLFYTQITDAGLEYLTRLTDLDHLVLHNTQITDDGLEHLTRLTNLAYLGLSDTQISDAGLEHLKQLTNLELLYLSGTHVTDEGIEELRKALPDCEIR